MIKSFGRLAFLSVLTQNGVAPNNTEPDDLWLATAWSCDEDHILVRYFIDKSPSNLMFLAPTHDRRVLLANYLLPAN